MPKDIRIHFVEHINDQLFLFLLERAIADDMQESSSVHVHGMRGLIALQHNRTDMIELPDGCRIIIPRFIRLIKGVDYLSDLP